MEEVSIFSFTYETVYVREAEGVSSKPCSVRETEKQLGVI
jgi:hypothetical protein